MSWNTALPAFSLQPRTAASPPLRFRSAITTDAPSPANLSTVAPPIPLAAPVMTAIFVSNLPIFFSAVRLTRLTKHDLKSRPSVAQTAAWREAGMSQRKGKARGWIPKFRYRNAGAVGISSDSSEDSPQPRLTAGVRTVGRLPERSVSHAKRQEVLRRLAARNSVFRAEKKRTAKTEDSTSCDLGQGCSAAGNFEEHSCRRAAIMAACFGSHS